MKKRNIEYLSQLRIIKQYLQENKRERYKLNIYNFEKSFKTEKAKKLFTLNDELMEILLQKIIKKIMKIS